MSERGRASEKLTHIMHFNITLSNILLHKQVHEKTLDSLIVHHRLIPVLWSGWMYTMEKRRLWSCLLPRNTAPLWSPSHAFGLSFSQGYNFRSQHRASLKRSHVTMRCHQTDTERWRFWLNYYHRTQ